MITSDQLKDVMERAEALHHYLDIDKKKIEFEEEQLRTQAPDFWDDPKRAQEQMKKDAAKIVEGEAEKVAIRSQETKKASAFDEVFEVDKVEELANEMRVKEDYSRDGEEA